MPIIDVADPHSPARDALKLGFQEYISESDQMQKLLSVLTEASAEIRLRAIGAQQWRMDAARERYHAACDEYIREVLGSGTK